MLVQLNVIIRRCDTGSVQQQVALRKSWLYSWIFLSGISKQNLKLFSSKRYNPYRLSPIYRAHGFWIFNDEKYLHNINVLRIIKHDGWLCFSDKIDGKINNYSYIVKNIIVEEWRILSLKLNWTDALFHGCGKFLRFTTYLILEYFDLFGFYIKENNIIWGCREWCTVVVWQFLS